MACQAFNYDGVRSAIRDLLNQPGYDGYAPGTNNTAGPLFVRLAWHASGTYDKQTDTGGSNGAGMRFAPESADSANAGLHIARSFLEPLKKACPWISYADLWTLAGAVAIEEMGGPLIAWKPGRTDFTSGAKCPPRGRLPDAHKGQDHLRKIFHRMGFTDQEIVALSGAHNLGKCHHDRSGYNGPWVRHPTLFSNGYFKHLRDLKWRPKKWDGPHQFINTDFGTELMMLPTDISLIADPTFKGWVDKYADDSQRFSSDFGQVFSKLLELGVKRDQHLYVPANHQA